MSRANKIVPLPAGVAETQLQRTRDLAAAFAQLATAEAALREAKTAVDKAFAPWAAGRRISRTEAREQLVSTGHLPRRKVWQ